MNPNPVDLTSKKWTKIG